MIALPITYKKNYNIEDIIFQDGSGSQDPLNRPMALEVDYAKTASFENQHSWIGARVVTLEASKQIVKETFNFDRHCVAEFGCGAYGWFYNHMLPKKTNLIQFDINQEVVRHNKEYTKGLELFVESPKVVVGGMYDMPLKNSSVDVVLGFSSWDSIFFYERSIKEIKRCLKQGGFFVHYQNLHPADKPLVLTEAKKRLEAGLDSHVPCGFGLPKFKPIYIPGTQLKIGETRIDEFLTIDSIEYGEVRLGEYLVNHLRSLFEKQGFVIHECGEVQKEVLTKKKQFLRRLGKFGFKLEGDENYFKDGYGVLNFGHDNSIPNEYVKEWASMDVIIAQKLN